jgi:hypothetical protein
MAIHDHEHNALGEFEAGCSACEVDEVSLQDTGRPWGARIIRHPSHAATRRHFATNPLPSQTDRRTA